MIISSNVFLKGLSIHRISESGLQLSEKPIFIQNNLIKEVLVKYFFDSFKDDVRYSLTGEPILESNVVYNFVSSIFDNPDLLHEKSVELAKWLFEESVHPNIKGGDFFTVHFEDCVLDDEVIEVIGLFKAEQQETYLKVVAQDGVFGLDAEDGININKIDKGALIFNTEKDQGYVVLSIDNTNKGGAYYWNNSFLNLKPVENQYYQTQQLVHLCQDFISEAVPEDDKAGKIALFNNSMDYLKSNETFKHEEFKEEVLQEPELIASYEEFREQMGESNEVLQQEEMELSKPAVKQSKKFIRSVIKLDKNFHVYVHGNRENIDKGFDSARQKNYYTLYFEEEN
ncbi:MAG: nucleoid-associated protein [Cyclobacteriaceae bacterium]